MTALELRGLSVRFPTRSAPAVKDFNCALEKGEVVVLAGPSGSGKSTVLHAAIGYIPEGIPAEVSGEVLLGGVPAPPGLAQRAQRLGLVQQDPEAGLCTLRVRDEVAFGPENLALPQREISGRVDRALAATGMERLAGRETWKLSGGEKQRAALAAALSLDPEVLLLDEPTAHLDPQAAQQLFSLLGRQAHEGRALLVAEHRLGPLRIMNPRFVCLGGSGSTGDDRQQRAANTQLRRPGPQVLDVRALQFSYPEGNELLGGVSFALGEGEVLGVAGPNGTGKSTLLRILAGLVRPQGGSVRIDGCDPASLAPKARRRQLALVFQMPHHQLFSPTVADELALGAEGGSKWLSRAGLSALAAEHPLRLSIGERRRLTVALALAQGPRVLLMDEPFIGQDRENAEWVARQVLRASQQGVAVVMVSHRIPMLARLAHRVLFMGQQMMLGAGREVFGQLRSCGLEEFTPEYWNEPW